MTKLRNAQKWLDKKYPSGKKTNIKTIVASMNNKTNIKKLDISNKNLEGSLKLEGFNSLEKLDCSGNLITELDLSSCDAEKLIELNVGSNDFDEQNLDCFSRFTKLKKLYLGSNGGKKSEFNCFTGSLKPLKDLVELEELDISNTDINSGLEFLPESLEKLYCLNQRGDEAGCEKIRKELRNYLDESELYYDLSAWRRFQKNKNKKIVLRGSSTEAQGWLDNEYLKKDRNDRVKLDISRSELVGKTILEGSLNLTDFKNLRLLDCSGQKITKLELADYKHLKELICENNQLTSLNIKDCPKLIKIKCSRNKLDGLIIRNCPKLNSLHCSDNHLTNFEFKSLNKEELISFNLNNNRLSSRNLDELVNFINLESIDIGSNDREKIEEGGYNQFYGSLKSLKNMTKLKYLNVEATDIEDGLEYLPESLEVFFCASHGILTEVDKIEKILQECSDSPQTTPSQSHSSLALGFPITEKERAVFPSFNFGFNYFDNLQKWREDNDGLVQAVKVNDNNQQEWDTHELAGGSIVRQNLTKKIEEKEKLINFLKARYQDGEEECLELLYATTNELKELEKRWQFQEQTATVEEISFQRNF